MVSIQLQDRVAAALSVQAESMGLTLEDFLTRLAEDRCLPSPPRLSADEFERLFDAESSDESTYKGTYSRADIYGEHA